MFTSDIPDDWTPPEPPAIGSKLWLDNMAFRFMVESFDGLPDRSGVFKLPRVQAGGETYELGYFALFRNSCGADYFRVDDIESVVVKPRVTDE